VTVILFLASLHITFDRMRDGYTGTMNFLVFTLTVKADFGFFQLLDAAM
jgi:hypothetical protein